MMGDGQFGPSPGPVESAADMQWMYIFHALVVDWAFLGILLKRRAEISTAESAAAGITGTAVAAQSRPVVIAAVVGLSLISVGIITQLTRKKVYRA